MAIPKIESSSLQSLLSSQKIDIPTTQQMNIQVFEKLISGNSSHLNQILTFGTRIVCWLKGTDLKNKSCFFEEHIYKPIVTNSVLKNSDTYIQLDDECDAKPDDAIAVFTNYMQQEKQELLHTDTLLKHIITFMINHDNVTSLIDFLKNLSKYRKLPFFKELINSLMKYMITCQDFDLQVRGNIYEILLSLVGVADFSSELINDLKAYKGKTTENDLILLSYYFEFAGLELGNLEIHILNKFCLIMKELLLIQNQDKKEDYILEAKFIMKYAYTKFRKNNEDQKAFVFLTMTTEQLTNALKNYDMGSATDTHEFTEYLKILQLGTFILNNKKTGVCDAKELKIHYQKDAANIGNYAPKYFTFSSSELDVVRILLDFFDTNFVKKQEEKLYVDIEIAYEAICEKKCYVEALQFLLEFDPNSLSTIKLIENTLASKDMDLDQQAKDTIKKVLRYLYLSKNEFKKSLAIRTPMNRKSLIKELSNPTLGSSRLNFLVQYKMLWATEEILSIYKNKGNVQPNSGADFDPFAVMFDVTTIQLKKGRNTNGKNDLGVKHFEWSIWFTYIMHPSTLDTYFETFEEISAFENWFIDQLCIKLKEYKVEFGNFIFYPFFKTLTIKQQDKILASLNFNSFSDPFYLNHILLSLYLHPLKTFCAATRSFGSIDGDLFFTQIGEMVSFNTQEDDSCVNLFEETIFYILTLIEKHNPIKYNQVLGHFQKNIILKKEEFTARSISNFLANRNFIKDISFLDQFETALLKYKKITTETKPTITSGKKKKNSSKTNYFHQSNKTLSPIPSHPVNILEKKTINYDEYDGPSLLAFLQDETKECNLQQIIAAYNRKHSYLGGDEAEYLNKLYRTIYKRIHETKNPDQDLQEANQYLLNELVDIIISKKACLDKINIYVEGLLYLCRIMNFDKIDRLQKLLDLDIDNEIKTVLLEYIKAIDTKNSKIASNSVEINIPISNEDTSTDEFFVDVRLFREYNDLAELYDSYVKRDHFIAKLQGIGCEKIKNNGKHPLFSYRGERIPVPDGDSIAPGTAKNICETIYKVYKQEISKIETDSP